MTRFEVNSKREKVPLVAIRVSGLASGESIVDDLQLAAEQKARYPSMLIAMTASCTTLNVINFERLNARNHYFNQKRALFSSRHIKEELIVLFETSDRGSKLFQGHTLDLVDASSPAVINHLATH